MKTMKITEQRPRRSKTSRALEIAAYGLVGAICISQPVLAQEVGGMIQNAADMVVSGWGKGIALLAVIIVGIGCLSGRINLAAAFSVVLGIAIIFSAGTIVSGIQGGA